MRASDRLILQRAISAAKENNALYTEGVITAGGFCEKSIQLNRETFRRIFPFCSQTRPCDDEKEYLEMVYQGFCIFTLIPKENTGHEV